MMILKNENMTFPEGLLFSLVAIAIVFLVLALLVVIVSLMSKIKFNEKSEKAAPAPAAPVAQKNFTVDDIKDEDMMVAALVATADFIEETKKTDVRVISVKQIG